MHNLPSPAPVLLQSLASATPHHTPYPHWLLNHVLPDEVIDALCALPFAAPDIADTMGRRETNNTTRRFFGAQEQNALPLCAGLATMFQSSPCINALQNLTGTNLRGSFLRIEYCQDGDGFWLEPHTDIGAKFFTMLIYLNNPPSGEDWGTDIYESPTKHLGTAASGRNQGLIFVPSTESWHGFERRRITGIRRSMIVNYVTPEWRARHELAFAENPIR